MANFPSLDWNGKNFMFKGYVTLIIPGAPELSVSAYEMGKSMVSVNFLSQPNERLDTAYADTVSANFAVKVEVKLELDRTLDKIVTYYQKVFSNSIVDKGLTLKLDNGLVLEMTRISLGIDSITSDGSDAGMSFTFRAVMACNTDLAV